MANINSLNKSFSYNSLSDIEKDNLYNIFKTSYEKTLGTSWDKSKFESRAYNWLFFGDQTGFISVRPQKSGMYKLVGVAGSLKGIISGLNELMATNKPIWGMVSNEIKNMAIKVGFITPSPYLIKIFLPMIPKDVFGGVDYEVNNDGSLTFKYSDVGDSKKYFIGNDAYFDQLKSLAGDKIKAATIDKLKSATVDKIHLPFFNKNNDQKSLKETIERIKTIINS